MNKELKNVLGATESKAQYDASAKRLLGQKSILAHILVKTVDEFQGMNPREVERYIEGTPCISTVPVEPGLTNAVRGMQPKEMGKDWLALTQKAENFRRDLSGLT